MNQPLANLGMIGSSETLTLWRRVAAPCLLIVAACASPAVSIEIVLDYSLDEANWNWFSGSPAGLERRASLEAAAGFLSATIKDDDWAPVAIDSTTINLSDIFQSSIFDLEGQPIAGVPESDGTGFSYQIPLTNRSTVGANELVVYVSALAFDTGSGAHAKAAPNGAARRNSAGLAGEEFNTWGGRVQFDLSDAYYAGQNPGANPVDDYGFQDPDKNPSADTPTDDYVFSTSSFTWKGFDLEKTDPAADGRFDLYSTSVHELMHALGMTTANLPAYIGTDGFGNLTGVNAVAAYGGPVPFSGGHVAENVESVIWASEDIVSETLIDPNSRRGVRRYLTELDAALLRDLGYDIATEFPSDPLPGDYNRDGWVDAADYTVWRDTLDSVEDLDADGDGDGIIDADDYSVWSNAYGSVSSDAYGLVSPTTVPESTTSLLLVVAVASIVTMTRPAD